MFPCPFPVYITLVPRCKREVLGGLKLSPQTLGGLKLSLTKGGKILWLTFTVPFNRC